MELNKLICVKLSQYNENKKENYITFKNSSDLISEFNNSKLKQTCMLEVLQSNFIRVFLDIEKIPTDQPDLIYSIINDISEFLSIDKNLYTLTTNNGSHHSGLSYHLYFPYFTTKQNMLNVIRNFILETEKKYEKYIDQSVYSKNRLFRLPYQYSPLLEINDPNYDRQKDYHVIIKGDIKDCIVQNITNLRMIKSDYPPVKTTDLESNNISAMNEKIIMELTTILEEMVNEALLKQPLEKVDETTFKKVDENESTMKQSEIMTNKKLGDNINKLTETIKEIKSAFDKSAQKQPLEKVD